MINFTNYDDEGFQVDSSEAKGFITTFYNQSKGGSNLIQTEKDQQPYIIDSSDLILNSDETVGIKFEIDDTLYVEEENRDVTNLEVLVKYQYLTGIEDSILFNLNSNGDRVSAQASEENNQIYWDVSGSENGARLEKDFRDFSNSNSQISFMANYQGSDEGTSAKNRTDAKQAIFFNGEAIAFDGNLKESSTSISTGGSWQVGSITDMHLSQFMVYQSENSEEMTTPNNIYGTSEKDTINFTGESNLNYIDGGEDIDTLKISDNNNFDMNLINLKNIEYVDMRNQEANNFIYVENNETVIKILMDSGDSINSNVENYEIGKERIIYGTTLNDTITMSRDNEVIYGLDGDDTYIYNSWDKTRDDGTIAIDTFKDISFLENSSDKINLENLFYIEDSEELERLY